MCRICGRVVKCIFDSMPSRIPSVVSRRSFATASRARSVSTQNHISTVRQQTKSPTYLTSYSANASQARATSTPLATSIPTRSRQLHQVAYAQAEVPPPLPQTPGGSTSTAADDLLLQSQSQPQPQSQSQSTLLNNIELTTTTASTSSKPLILSRSLQTLLPLLTAQKPHYIQLHIHRFPYLLTTGDTLRLPFHMPHVTSGDILRLNRASLLGSRDYTLKAGHHTSISETYDSKRTGEPTYLDDRLFEVRARVLGVETGPMFTKEKTKRRNRKVKTVRSKHKYTMLRVMEVRVKSLEELKMEKGMSLLLES